MFSLKTFIPATLLAVAFGAPVAAQNYQFEVVNQSAYTVLEMYTSATTESNWGPDILGANVLPGGTSTIVTIGDGRSDCLYDIKFVLDDNSALEDVIDICSTGTYTLY